MIERGWLSLRQPNKFPKLSSLNLLQSPQKGSVSLAIIPNLKPVSVSQ